LTYAGYGGKKIQEQVNFRLLVLERKNEGMTRDEQEN